MILISELRVYLEEKKAALSEVTIARLAVKEDDVVRFLRDVKDTDKQIMLCLMPEARSNGRDEDNVRLNNATEFLFLEKSNYGSEKYDQWLDTFQRTQVTALEFFYMLLDEINSGKCGWNRFLDINNINIEPVSGLASCNGWSVTAYFDVPV